jgi:hypothetical protein
MTFIFDEMTKEGDWKWKNVVLFNTNDWTLPTDFYLSHERYIIVRGVKAYTSTDEPRNLALYATFPEYRYRPSGEGIDTDYGYVCSANEYYQHKTKFHYVWDDRVIKMMILTLAGGAPDPAPASIVIDLLLKYR